MKTQSTGPAAQTRLKRTKPYTLRRPSQQAVLAFPGQLMRAAQSRSMLGKCRWTLTYRRGLQPKHVHIVLAHAHVVVVLLVADD